MKLLIIDDDKWYSESLASSLKSVKDIYIKTVLTPEEAIVLIDDFMPDAVLLDFNLGTNNALTILNELQSYTDTRDIPIILLFDNNKKIDTANLKKYNVKVVLNKATTTPKEILKCLEV